MRALFRWLGTPPLFACLHPLSLPTQGKNR